jgi:hypothetical protein
MGALQLVVEIMILPPRNIVLDGPDVFSKIAAIGINPLASSAEGSPIYQTIDAEITVTGSYTVGTVTYDYSGTATATQRIRDSIRTDAALDIYGENYEITRSNDVSTWIDFGAIISAPENTFAAVQSNYLGCNGGTPPFAPPGFLLAPPIIEYIDGTSTDSSISPPLVEDVSVELQITPPYFTGSIQGGDLKMNVNLSIVENGNPQETFVHEIDASGWGVLDFRDIRGTYGTTSYDSNGIEYVWSITIG